MHIGFDGKRFFQNVTGLGNYARGTVLGLAEHFPEHRYTLFAPRLTGPFCTMPLPEALHVQEACPAGRAFPALWRSLAIPAAASRDRVDIFHGLSHELPLTNFPPQVRTVVTMHDLLFLTHPHLYPWADRKLYAWKYRHSCRRADLVVAISERTAEDVQELFGVRPDRIRVAYQSCSPAFSAPMGASNLAGLRSRNFEPLTDYAELDKALQEQILKDLQSGKIAFESVPSKTFFSFLLANTKEGFFADPIYGGNKGMVGWKMVGFPGARADFMDWADQPNVKYPYGPVSISGEKG